MHNQIKSKEAQYRLKFLLRGRGVYTISYDDVCYPENAVKIMSDGIIKNLSKL